jgi:ubiquinone/menaquinone biosynthesis C-methylase UbiE
MTPPEQQYVMDPELMAEMMRLESQGRLLTRSMGGVLPELSQQQRSSLHDVLDLACGPGEWALALAFEYPDMHVVGVDISHIMIEYAQAQAGAQQLPVDFRVMSILKHPMPFDDASFDVVNMRLVFGILFPEQWPLLLADCLRILKPGGIIRITEFERAISNNAVFERYEYVWTQAFYRDHRTFSPDGHHYGSYPVLKLLLKRAGFTQLRHIPYMIDVSADSQAHQAFFADLLAAWQVGLPFLQRVAGTQAECDELETLSEQMRGLVNQEDFCAYWPLMTFLGYKPETE